jgi:hypothetical protein
MKSNKLKILSMMEPKIKWRSSNEEVATVDPNGYVRHVSDGKAKIYADTKYGSYGKELQFTSTIVPSLGIFNGFAINSFGRKSIEEILLILENSYTIPSSISYDSNWNNVNESKVIIIEPAPPGSDIQDYLSGIVTDPDKVYVYKGYDPDVIFNWLEINNRYYAVNELNRFIVQNDADSYYLNNPFFWARDYDFTGVSVTNTNSDSITLRTKTGTLVTKKHMAHVKHASYTPSVGSTVRFVTQDNQIVERTIISRWESPDRDFGMTELNEEVPDNIKIYKVLPDNYSEYIPVSVGLNAKFKQENGSLLSVGYQGGGLIAICMTQNKLIYPLLVRSIANSNVILSEFTPTQYKDIKIKFSSGYISVGDSGSPMFIPLNGELINFGFVGGFALIYKSFIDNAISQFSISQGYEATSIDLSLLKNYS